MTSSPLSYGTVDQGEVSLQFSKTATVFAAVAASTFSAVGIAGNLFTVVALLRCQKLRSHATTTFVISLAISDLLFCTINLPLTASRYIYEEWTLGPLLCRLFPFFFYGNVAASIMNMVAITINRYVLISYHANYRQIYTNFKVFLMISFVWLFSFGIMVPPLVEVWGTLGLDEPTFSCTILRKDGKSPKKFLMVFGFLLPCIVIIACYTAIFMKVRQSRRNIQSRMNGACKASSPAPSKPAQTVQRREDIRLTKMMLTIFLCFLVCFLPLMLVNVADDSVRYPNLHVVASVLAWASAVVNPFIYAFKNRQYQQAFVKVRQQVLWCRERPDSSLSSRKRPTPSKESKTSGSRTFMTDALHFNTATVKVNIKRLDCVEDEAGQSANDISDDNNINSSSIDRREVHIKESEIV